MKNAKRFAAAVMSYLPVPDENDMPAVIGVLAKLHAKGFTIKDAVDYSKNLEEFHADPEDEHDACLRMNAIMTKYTPTS